MRLSSDFIFSRLSPRMSISQRGASISELRLTPPLFYHFGMEYQDDAIYIGRSEDFQQAPRGVSCLIVSIGGFPFSGMPNSKACIFSVTSNDDMLYVFNCIQEVFHEADSWYAGITSVRETTADLDEIVELTSGFLGLPIIYVNERLEVVTSTAQSGLEDVANEYTSPQSISQFADSHQMHIRLREPFVYHVDEIDADMYCINLFIRETYRGVLILQLPDDERARRGCEALFELFSEVFVKAFKKRDDRELGRGGNRKAALVDLLNRMPVPEARLENAGLTSQGWFCLAAKPVSYMANIPYEYIVDRLEAACLGLIAIAYNDHIVLLVPCVEKEYQKEILFSLTEPLRELSLKAGCSFVFESVRAVYTAFRQAVIALGMAAQSSDAGDGPVFTFTDYALDYALKNSVGELSPHSIISDNLTRMREEDELLWETLKVYLDNEMNVSETSRELFVHRSTLQYRLKKIESLVDLSTPRERLYARYCIYLYELYQKLDA